MRRFFTAIALLAAMATAAPLIAADAPGYGVVIGGRVRYDIGWQVLSGDRQASNTTDDTLINFFSGIVSNSYLSATFTSADKTTGARVEMGLNGNTNLNNSGGAQSNNDVTLRLAYGWWKVGSCTLLAGQSKTRLGSGVEVDQIFGATKSVKTDMQGFGFLGGTRAPRLALAMEVNDNFGFEISIAQAGAEVTANSPAVYSAAGSTQNYLPRLEVVLDFKAGGFKISPGAGISYQKWEFTAANTNADDSVLSYLFFLPVKYQNGPFWAVLSALYGQNIDTDWSGENTSANSATYRAYGGQNMALPVSTANGIENTKIWGIGLGLGYAISEQFTLKAAGGFDHLSNDGWGVGEQEDSYTRWGIWLAAPYKLTSNLTIQPEIGYFNYGDRTGMVDTKAGSEWLIGVNFQFLF
jgi:hypothetical protein